jgi:sugar lactone lactonase YvrE
VSATEILVEGLVFPECPRWRPDGLWFSDQHAGHVQRVKPGGGAEVMVEILGRPSGLGWLSDGTLMAVSMHEKKLLRIRFSESEAGSAGEAPDVAVAADLAPLHAGYSNDMVVDAQGRCYIGDIGYDIYGGEAPRATVLVLVESFASTGADGAVVQSFGAPEAVADDLLTPNGTVITAEGDRLIIAESMAHRLTSFRITDNGRLTDRQLFADLDDETPDGICLDAEGAIWFASVSRREVVRVQEGGKITNRIPTSGGRAIACMLGGDDGRDLFVCVAGSINPEKTVVLRNSTIETSRVDVPHAGLP